jgi:hypothetical protein
MNPTQFKKLSFDIFREMKRNDRNVFKKLKRRHLSRNMIFT